MNLTREYREITAVFDSPVKFSEEMRTVNKAKKQVHIYRTFLVPPFEYEVLFREPSDRPDGTYIVSFKLIDIHAEGEELARILTKILKKPVSPGAAPLMKKLVNPMGILGVGSSSKVLGTVIQIMRNFVNEHRARCLVFAAVEESRQDLYRRMANVLGRGHRVSEIRPGVIQICFKK
jgi:hypothetical protein